jgi:putative ABC transport system permease protein
MHLNLRPLLAALSRNPTGALLVVAQIAITLAVLCNAASLVAHAIARINRPVGLDVRDTFVMSVSPFANDFNIASAERADLAYLRALPDVAAATVTNGRPLTHDGTFETLARRPDSAGPQTEAGMLPVDAQGLAALGVPLAAGRNFRSEEIAAYSASGSPRDPSEIIVTEALAHALFPTGGALGATVYDGDTPLTIIGISRDFMGPQAGQPAYNVFLEPQMSGSPGYYELLVRARPGRRDATLAAAKRHLATAHPDAAVELTQTLAEARRNFNAGNRSMAIFLSVVTAVMLAVCCLGLFGLAAFNVSSRTKQIGVRRAVGARRRDIVAYFVTESALILGAGAAIGSVLALALGQWLSDHYGEPRLDLTYVFAGILTLWIIGQLAAWEPARRAAAVPPSVATRTV